MAANSVGYVVTPSDLYRACRSVFAGVAHYHDLTQSVTRAEADTIGQIVEEAVGAKLPGARVTLVGGFRR